MKEIQLTKGYIALIDDEDYDLVSTYKWQINIPYKRAGVRYAMHTGTRRNGTTLHIKMHRLVMGVTDPKIRIDHIDGDGLNNQKGNLRIATPGQNRVNFTAHQQRKHGTPYVGIEEHRGKYRAVFCGQKTRMLATAEEAALAYNQMAYAKYGEFAHLNVIPTEENGQAETKTNSDGKI